MNNYKIAGKRLFSYYVDAGTGKAEPILPTILWDLDHFNKTVADPIDLDKQKSVVQDGVIAMLRDYQKEILEERQRQTKIKEKYGVRSLEKLIRDHDEDLLSLHERQRAGQNVDIVIRNKEERQRQYIDSKRKLIDLIEREKSLTVNTPTFRGIARVIPSTSVLESMRENFESEMISMEAAMEFERSQGRNPEDVSKIIGLGYDVKSTGYKGEIRYIEVKGRHEVGQVALTRNEWFKARHLAGNYYLYVVWNTKYKNDGIPPIYRIRDPTRNVNAKEDIHYIIDVEEIRRCSE